MSGCTPKSFPENLVAVHAAAAGGAVDLDAPPWTIGVAPLRRSGVSAPVDL